jgi:hypothetical protein
MVNQPATGATWDPAGLGNTDNRFLERGKLVAVLVRDARGLATDLSPHNSDGSVRWSPLGEDNKIRGDLFAFVRVNGIWMVNPEDNEGFHLVGAFKEGNGPSSKPKIDNDDFMIVQQNFPFDSNIVSQTTPVTFTGVETAKPLMRRLENNLPLNDPDTGDVLVELPGALGQGWSLPLDQENVDRQILLIREKKIAGQPFYKIDGYNLAKLNDLGEAKQGDKKDSEARDMTYQPLPDGIMMGFVDGEYRPIIKHTWHGGVGWANIGGSPILTGAATATAGATGKATVAFADPTGGDIDGAVITGEYSTDGGTTWNAGVLDTPNAVTSATGTTTVKLKSLSAGSTKLRGKVVGNNGAVSYTPASNTITVS